MGTWDDVGLHPVDEMTRGRRATLVGLSAVVAMAVLAVLILEGLGTVSAGATLALVVLTAIATHREAIYPDETALSGSVVVICACIVGLGDASLLPPVLCGAVAALHREHLRDRQVLKIFVNLSATVAPALVATQVYRAFGPLVAEQIAGAALAVGSYWLLNNAVVGSAVGLVQGRGFSCVWPLIRSDTVMLVFGLGGGLCGVVMVEVGTWVGLSTLVALLVALDVFVISVPGGLVDLRAAWLMIATRSVSGGVAGTVGALVARGLSVSVLGAFAGLAAGIAAGVGTVALVVAVRLLLRYGRADVATIGGLLVVESVVPIMAASSAVVAVVAGLEAGLFFASGLVVIVSATVGVRRRHAVARPQITDEDTLMVAVVEAMMDGLPARDR